MDVTPWSHPLTEVTQCRNKWWGDRVAETETPLTILKNNNQQHDFDHIHEQNINRTFKEKSVPVVPSICTNPVYNLILHLGVIKTSHWTSFQDSVGVSTLFRYCHRWEHGRSNSFNHTEIIPRWHYCLHSTCYAVFFFPYSSTASIFHCHFKLSTLCPALSLPPLLLCPWYKCPLLLSENTIITMHGCLLERERVKKIKEEEGEGEKANDVGLSSELIKIL